MPFIGGLPQPLKSMALEAVRDWPVSDVYVGCSGNFGLERALASVPVKCHSNDISLYSSAIGAHLTGAALGLAIKDQEYAWLESYLKTPLDTVATLLLCTSMLRGYGKDSEYWLRHVEAYRVHFSDLHGGTKAKAEKALGGLKVASYYAGDVLDHLSSAPAEAGIMTAPPTYKGGYERLYKSMDKVFDWRDRPSYRMFDESSMSQLMGILTSRPHWLLFNDQLIEDLRDHLVGIAVPSLRKRPVYCYGGLGHTRLARTRELTRDPHLKRLPPQAEISPSCKLRLMKLDAPAFRWLRDCLLGKNILPAQPQFAFAVMLDDHLVGLLGVGRQLKQRGIGDLYMMCDVAVPHHRYRRLGKLVLAASLSRELRLSLSDGGLVARAKTIGTTAFTEKPVSMKYRGIYKLHSRKEGHLNYVGELGRWTLQEGLEWWLQNHGTSTN
jgi:hypothetical protein